MLQEARNCETESDHVTDTAQGGDHKPSFDAVCGPLMEEMRRYARGLTKDRTHADDVIQDAFIHAWKAWDRWAPHDPANLEGCARAWLYKIVSRHFVSSLRNLDARGRCETTYVAGDQEYAVLQNQDRSGESNDRVTVVVPVYRPREDEACGDEVLRAMYRLDPKYREAVVKHYLEESSLEEVADETGCTRTAVGQHLYRARGQLKKSLRAYAKAEYGIGSKPARVRAAR